MINPVWGHIAGVITVILMLTLIAIWIWAWRKQHRPTFTRMAQIPMEDKPEGPLPEAFDKAPDNQEDHQP